KGVRVPPRDLAARLRTGAPRHHRLVHGPTVHPQGTLARYSVPPRPRVDHRADRGLDVLHGILPGPTVRFDGSPCPTPADRGVLRLRLPGRRNGRARGRPEAPRGGPGRVPLLVPARLQYRGEGAQ